MIKILSENLSNKIAAGEVIDRPSAVLKELLENAIDSNALNINVYIDGTDIRVDDDGSGMSKDDLSLAIKRFATSKISREDDLYSIHTFGFRGEALPSIVSVSKTIIISRKINQDFGYKMEVFGGKIVKISEFGAKIGTSIEVKDIFYNTPARLKFMKSEETEYRYILSIFEDISLVNSNIYFKLFKKGNLVYDFFPEDIENRFKKILPKGEYKFLKLNYLTEDISISGFISVPEITRSGKDYQYIYVNKRIVSNNAISKAVIDGYSNFLDNNRYPIYLINIDINPDSVDVNVHPRKMEVRFNDLNKVYSIIKTEINKLLTGSKSSSFYPISKQNRNQDQDITHSQKFVYPKKNYDQNLNTNQQRLNIQSGLNLLDISVNKNNFDVLQLFNKFIITSFEDKLQIIDQHAASERVMYEKIREHYSTSNIELQSFLIPYSIELNEKDFLIFSNNLETFQKTGLDFEIFGDNIIKISSLPLILKDINLELFVNDLIADIKEYKFNRTEDKEHYIIATIACHSSVRFGDKLENDKMIKIIEDLKECKDPYFCPHGRPTTYEIPLDELLKKFRRK
jgi:DNA mismatch repair protein MutL